MKRKDGEEKQDDKHIVIDKPSKVQKKRAMQKTMEWK